MHSPRARSLTFRPCRRSRAAGFTLIELLTVIAVLGIMAGIVFSSVGAAGKPTALRSAQATLANALSATRHRALARGVPVALAVHDDPSNPARYRRMVAVVESIQTAAPEVVAVFELPKHAYVLPHRSRFVEALREPGNWAGGSSQSLLGSTRFLNPNGVISIAINSPTAERWEYALVTARGTMSGSGALIVGLAQPTDGFFPICFESPERVRGMMVSQYGLARMIDGREGF